MCISCKTQLGNSQCIFLCYKFCFERKRKTRIFSYGNTHVKRLHRYTGTGIKVHGYIDIKQFRYTYDRTRQLMTERVCIFTRFYHEISQLVTFIIFSQRSCYGCFNITMKQIFSIEVIQHLSQCEHTIFLKPELTQLKQT